MMGCGGGTLAHLCCTETPFLPSLLACMQLHCSLQAARLNYGTAFGQLACHSDDGCTVCFCFSTGWPFQLCHSENCRPAAAFGDCTALHDALSCAQSCAMLRPRLGVWIGRQEMQLAPGLLHAIALRCSWSNRQRKGMQANGVRHARQGKACRGSIQLCSTTAGDPHQHFSLSGADSNGGICSMPQHGPRVPHAPGTGSAWQLKLSACCAACCSWQYARHAADALGTGRGRWCSPVVLRPGAAEQACE